MIVKQRTFKRILEVDKIMESERIQLRVIGKVSYCQCPKFNSR